MKKVLVYDDHLFISEARIYDWFIEKIYGDDVEIHYVGEHEDFIKLIKNDYMLVILDWDFGNGVYAKDIYHDVRCEKKVIITGYSDHQDVKGWCEKNSAPLLAKPIRFDEYLQALKEAIL